MSYSYEYDKSGFASSYLGLSFILPIALYYLYKFLFKKKIFRINCRCESCKQLSSEKNFLENIFLISLWILVAVLIKNVMVINLEIKRDFNPLEILGIDLGTPGKLIKKKMIRLMLKYDVQKAPIEKKEEYEVMLANISKAYNIVKNKEMFSKWLNNESKSGEIMAIPDIIMKNATLAFTIYCIILGMCLPNFAYRKWKNLKTKNALGIQFETMEVFINFFNEDLKKKCDIKTLIQILSKSKEFCTKKFSSNVKSIKLNVEYNYGYPLPNLKNVNDGFLILQDHLFRLNICKNKDLEFVRSKGLLLIEGMKYLAVSKGYVEIYKKLFILQAMITQGVFDEEYFLLQYPYIKFKDIFMMKMNGQKWDVEETLNYLLQGRELKEALQVYNRIKKPEIKEFIAVVINTGKIDEEEGSNIEDDNHEKLVLNEKKLKKSNIFKIEKGSYVTIKVKINLPKITESIHTYKIVEKEICTWTAFITIDSVLHKKLVFISENNTKDIDFTFDAPSNKPSSEVRLHLFNGQYFKNNVEDMIILKYI